MLGPGASPHRPLYQKAYRTWGIEAQLTMVIEEMSELTKEICKQKRKGLFETWPGITEELVDTEIMIEQLKIILSDHILEFDRVYQERRTEKLARLEGLLNGPR